MEKPRRRLNGEPQNGGAGRLEKLDSMPLAAALSNFQDKLIAGENPNPDELLSEYSEDRDEIETMLSLLCWGKEVLTPGSAGTIEDLSPCKEGATLGDYRVVREIGRGGKNEEEK